MSGFSARNFWSGTRAASNWLLSMSCWASSRRSLRGLASFWVRDWDWVDFCWGGWELSAYALLSRGAACCAPTTTIATAANFEKLRKLIVRAEDCLRHSRLYLKALSAWMRRWRGALPGRYH